MKRGTGRGRKPRENTLPAFEWTSASSPTWDSRSLRGRRHCRAAAAGQGVEKLPFEAATPASVWSTTGGAHRSPLSRLCGELGPRGAGRWLRRAFLGFSTSQPSANGRLHHCDVTSCIGHQYCGRSSANRGFTTGRAAESTYQDGRGARGQPDGQSRLTQRCSSCGSRRPLVPRSRVGAAALVPGARWPMRPTACS